MGFLVPFFPMLYRSCAMFSRFGRVVLGLIVVAGFVVYSSCVMVLCGIMVSLGRIRVMLGSGMF
jgi:hypothetical protein